MEKENLKALVEAVVMPFGHGTKEKLEEGADQGKNRIFWDRMGEYIEELF